MARLLVGCVWLRRSALSARLLDVLPILGDDGRPSLGKQSGGFQFHPSESTQGSLGGSVHFPCQIPTHLEWIVLLYPLYILSSVLFLGCTAKVNPESIREGSRLILMSGQETC